MNFTIEQIAKACRGKLFLHTVNEELQVSSVVLDSRIVTEGGVFVATVGERVDGHSFIPQVCKKGAALVVCERDPELLREQYDIPADCNFLWVENSFQALKDMALAYRLTLKLPVIGITGSVGKTSTKEFVAGVLSEKYQVLKTQGNYNNEVGVPLTLLSVRQEHTACVVEMGISDFGEMHRLSYMVRPNVCVITNIGQCHLENLKTRDGVLKAKTEIFDFMAEDGTVILNGDDDKLSTIHYVERTGKVPLFFGLRANAAAGGENGGCTKEVKECANRSTGEDNTERECVFAGEWIGKGLVGSCATICMNHAGVQGEMTVEIPIPGVHMVINACAATTVGLELGLTPDQIKAGLSKLQCEKGRGRQTRVGTVTLVDESYNANPASMRAAIDLLAMAENKKIAILGDMFELGEDSDAMHAGVGEYAAKMNPDEIFFVGENAKHMYEAAKKVREQNLYYFENTKLLMDALPEESCIRENSTILIKASHGMHFEEVLSFLEDLLASM